MPRYYVHQKYYAWINHYNGDAKAKASWNCTCKIFYVKMSLGIRVKLILHGNPTDV